MEPETQPLAPEPVNPGTEALPGDEPAPATPTRWTRVLRCLQWVFIGPQGLRAGWSIGLFGALTVPCAFIAGFLLSQFHLLDEKGHSTASAALFGELVAFLAILAAAAVVALIERRRNLLAFNLTGPRSLSHFLGGLAAGFAALSALILAMTWGGWMRFGHVALSGNEILRFGALWACAFLLVGCVEEGIFRGYLQFTLTRGINFWWALSIEVAISLRLILHAKGNGVWGVYMMALLGLLPCLWLHLKKHPESGFWQAAWVTSTLFGFIHTGNNGENWVGIFAAAFIGLVFCVSVRLTGTAWWAIGCHAAWDWSETYFYGAADSGMAAKGNLFTTIPVGNPLFSGGADGPEGSLLVLGVILLLLVALFVLYGRNRLQAIS